jgi:ABC-type multidrug transport system fused ATPase/permease subunit
MFKLLLDAIVTQQNAAGIVTISILSVFALRYVIDLVWDISATLNYDYLDRIFRQKFEDKLTLEFTKKISGLDIPHLENPETQNLIQKARKAYPWRLVNFYIGFISFFRDFGIFASSVVVLFPYGFFIPLSMAIATLPRFLYRNKYVKQEWIRFNQSVNESKDLGYIRGLLDDPSGVKEIRVSQASAHLLERVKNLQEYLLEIIRKPLKRYLPSFLLAILFEIIVLTILVYLKLPYAIAGTITLGTFTFYIQNLDRISGSSQNLASQVSRLLEQNLYVGYFFEVLDLPKIVKEKEKAVCFPKMEPPEIEFRNVSFRYGEGPKVLRDVSFKMKPGEHLAIVGPNGAGKTTIIRLLLRFYDPTEGAILVNGVNLKNISLSSWYKLVSILFQDFVKFSLTIKDNILLGDIATEDKQRMRDAAAKSGAKEFIEKLPKKYDTRLGKRFDDSVEISQGQWQKLALARMFYESAPLLILDEPTSAIDAEAEAEIFDNINEVYKDKSLLLISHRFSTVRNANKIIVLRNGQITEEGTHSRLMEKNRIYANMFRKQAKGYIE